MGNLTSIFLVGTAILIGSCGLIPEESQTTTDSTAPSDPAPSDPAPSDPAPSGSVIIASARNDANTVNAVVAVLEGGGGLSLTQGSDYYQIVGNELRLTQAGAAWRADNPASPLPVAAVTDGNDTEYLVTRRFEITDAVNLLLTGSDIYAGGSGYLETREDTDTSTTDKDKVVGFKISPSGIATSQGDVALDSSITFYTFNGSPDSLGGEFSLFRSTYADWSEASDTPNEQDRANLLSGKVMNASSNQSITVTEANQDGVPIIFDLDSIISSINETQAFLLEPSASSKRNFFVSDKEDSVSISKYKPHADFSYSTKYPIYAANDNLSIEEATSSVFSPLNLLENDTSIYEGTKEIKTINGTAWEDLQNSNSPLYVASQGFKQVTISHGTAYLKKDGRVYYDHDGEDISVVTTDSLTYTYSIGIENSNNGSLDISINPSNQAPSITLSGKNFYYNGSTASAASGDRAATINTTDPEGQKIAVFWTNGNSPADSSGNDIYQLAADYSAVLLTDTGAQLVNSGGELPEIRLAVADLPNQGLLTSKVSFATGQPYVARGNRYFIEKSSGKSITAEKINGQTIVYFDNVAEGIPLTNDIDISYGSQFSKPVATFDDLHNFLALQNGWDGSVSQKPDFSSLITPGDTLYVIGNYQLDTYDSDFLDSWDGDVANEYLWASSNAIKLTDLQGSAEAPITIKGWDETSIISNDSQGIRIEDSQHIQILDLEIDGSVNDITFEQFKPFHFLYRVNASDYLIDHNVLSYVNSFFKHVNGYDYFFKATPKKSAIRSLGSVGGIDTSGFNWNQIRILEDISGIDTIFDINPETLSEEQLESINLVKVSNPVEDATIRENNKFYADSFIKTATDADGISWHYFYRLPPKASDDWEYVEHYYSETNAVLPKNFDAQKVNRFSGGGINIKDSKYIKVANNYIHDVGGTGISGYGNEYYVIIGNKVENATQRLTSGSMGIVVRESIDLIDDGLNDGGEYKIIIANNLVSDVQNEFFSWVTTKDFVHPALDEGKGISPEHQELHASDYDGRMLLLGNLTWLNGVSGVNVHNAENADLINNTSFLSSAYRTIWGIDGGSAIGITSEHDDPNADGALDNQAWNNLGVVDGDLNGKAVNLNPYYRQGSSIQTNPGGGFNVTATLYADGQIRYDDDLLSQVPSFYLYNGTDLVISDGSLLDNYQDLSLRPLSGGLLDGGGYNPLNALNTSSPPRLDSDGQAQLLDVFSYDINGVQRSLDSPAIGALEAYSVDLSGLNFIDTND